MGLVQELWEDNFTEVCSYTSSIIEDDIPGERCPGDTCWSASGGWDVVSTGLCIVKISSLMKQSLI